MAEKREVRIKHRDRRMLGRNITTSEKVNSISDRDFRIWTHLLVSADDDGRVEGNPLTVKMACLPGLPYSVDEVAESLQNLHDIGLIIWYEASGKRFIQICQWNDHQRFHGFTRYPSIYPSPNGSSAAACTPIIAEVGEADSPVGEVGSPEIPESGEAVTPEIEDTGDTKRQEIRDKKEERHSSGTESPTSLPSESTKEKRGYPEDSEPYRLAVLLRSLILENKPNRRKVPAETLVALADWADDIRKLHELDGRDWETIERVLRWSQQDGFWWKNILSGGKLRKQFEMLEDAMTGRLQEASPNLHDGEYPLLIEEGTARW